MRCKKPLIAQCLVLLALLVNLFKMRQNNYAEYDRNKSK
ncbi:exported hypothetical protein [Clostridium neonatale]|nr:exported hypothetical protein [Clostridium neonatale]CAI3216132.1 exported hypothetical protein [Clostridium neonatale]CAI3216624.1 exported hypothetical protein [Clostridium neonatale]CAI3247962.1 exported hypothetical protein [Clostridium neonatale]CAI3702040.1 exported hypothetical protein [Clostridium neonatale]